MTETTTRRASGQDVATIGHYVVRALSDDLRKPKYRGDPNPMKGHCYVATQALYYLLGGKEAGLTPMNVQHEGDQHWFLRLPGGGFVDLTASQFRTPVPYASARGKGFMTNYPDKRAAEVIRRVKASLGASSTHGGGGARAARTVGNKIDRITSRRDMDSPDIFVANAWGPGNEFLGYGEGRTRELAISAARADVRRRRLELPKPPQGKAQSPRETHGRKS